MCVRLAALCLSACTHPHPKKLGTTLGGMACITNHHHRRSCNWRRAGRSLNLKMSILRCASRPSSQLSGFEMQSPLIYCDHICPTLLQAVMIACILLYCTVRAYKSQPSQPSRPSQPRSPLSSGLQQSDASFLLRNKWLLYPLAYLKPPGRPWFSCIMRTALGGLPASPKPHSIIQCYSSPPSTSWKFPGGKFFEGCGALRPAQKQ